MFGTLVIAALGVVQEPAVAIPSQPPEPSNPGAVLTPQDYPIEALRRNEHGIVTALLRVSIEGKVSACVVTESSGSATLDTTTCSLLKKRARFQPAKDAAGSPVDGEYRLAIAWGAGQRQPRTTIDIPLLVSTVPPDYRSPVKARLIFDSTGHVTACEVTNTSGSVAADRAACAYIKQELVIDAPRSASSDSPPVAVRYLVASLTTQTGGSAARK